MAIVAIVTNNGLSQSITAQSTNGWYIALSKFELSEISVGSRLPLTTSRTRSTIDETPSGPVFYFSPISSKIAQSAQLLQVNCTIPPNQNGNVATQITEIYLFGESPQFDLPSASINTNSHPTAPNTIDLSASFVSMLVDGNTVILKQNAGSTLTGSGLNYDDPTGILPIHSGTPVNAVYYVKKITSTRIKLYTNESLTTQVIFTGTGTGTHKICMEYLFAIGQPSTPIQYDPDGSTMLRLLFNLQNVDVSTIFQFPYTQATEIYDHNLDPNAHPDIQDALNEGGLYVTGASPTFEYKGQAFIRSTASEIDVAVTNKKPVYWDTATSKYKLARADGTSASKFIGFYFSSDISIRLHGIIDVGHAFAVNSDVYLSPSVYGGLTTTPSQVKIGRALASGKLLVSALSVGSEVTSLTELSDVTLTTPSSNQILRYDGTNWVNVNPDQVQSNTIVNIEQVSYQNQMVTNNYNNLYYDLLAQGTLVHVGTGSGYDSVNRRYNVNSGDTLTSGNLLSIATGTPFTEFRVSATSQTPANMTTQYSTVSNTGPWTTITLDTDYTIASFSSFYLKFTFSTTTNQLNSFGMLFDQSATPPVTYNLDDLNDVVITTPTNNQVLTYNGTNWVNSASGVITNLDGLSDVVITTPTNTQVLQYNGTNWINTNVPSLSNTLDDLTDVIVTTPSNTQVLQYNGTNWVNSSVTLDELSDVNTTGQATGDILVKSGSDWIPSSQFGSDLAVPISKLNNVSASSPTSGDLLQWDGTNWVNVSVSSLGIGDPLNITNTIQIPAVYTDTTSYFTINVQLYSGIVSGFAPNTYRSGNQQSIPSSSFAGYVSVLSSIVQNGYIYFMYEVSGGAEIRRCLVTNDISVSGNWSSPLTISGRALTTSDRLIGYGNGVFWITDGSSAFIPYTLSGTTLTSGTSVTVTGSNYIYYSSRVNNNGIYASFATAPKIRKANFSGTLDTNKQWDSNYACALANSFYCGTEIDEDGINTTVMLSKVD